MWIWTTRFKGALNNTLLNNYSSSQSPLMNKLTYYEIIVFETIKYKYL